jgi:citrate lyase subunit beta/citryl-CoA lyase
MGSSPGRPGAAEREEGVRPGCTYLFVPGDRLSVIARAYSRVSDALILDLEDAVAPAKKVDVGANAKDWISRVGDLRSEVWMRVNSGPEGDQDLLARDSELVAAL